ncbi:GIY-YIG nuclease family protein [Spongiivirga citrea]|uniref:GIY-YIG nuclease family protein n=1 Tax=Spongiivirga citrea TaxID=1481457 RepID=UPI00293BA7B6|nr:GIY-YIG nuclease family protein [Spongiivirga citrea]
MLKCSDNSFYAGITNNLSLRFKQHNAGYKKDSYTFSRRPVSLVFHQEFSDVLQAIYFEKKIKGWTRAKKRALIEGDFDMLQILAECRNATHHIYKPNE